MSEHHPFAPGRPPAQTAATTPPATTQRQQALLGIAMIVAAMTIIPIMDGIVKHMTSVVHPMQMVWARFFFHFFLFLPFILLRHGRQTWQLQKPVLQILRGSFLLITTIGFFYAFKVLPLADTLAVVFVYPCLLYTSDAADD